MTIKVSHLLMEFWPTIRDGELVVGGTSVKKVRDPWVREKDLICGGMFVTKLAKYFGLLTREMVDALSVREDDEAEKAAKEGVSGSSDLYMKMSRGDWQVRQSNWMFDHTVRHFHYLSTRDNLDPHLQINPFPGRKADCPPYGYTGPIPPGYDYRYSPALVGSD
ncbi:hypothetical protein Tco_0893175 [Tanacetum coccineum]|uniref:Uncharacterized protein n=1 Tax=Tanacetum coccineum TaxID=301880 RepID=A0ABQ5CAZ2_9ASTR